MNYADFAKMMKNVTDRMSVGMINFNDKKFGRKRVNEIFFGRLAFFRKLNTSAQ